MGHVWIGILFIKKFWFIIEYDFIKVLSNTNLQRFLLKNTRGIIGETSFLSLIIDLFDERQWTFICISMRLYVSRKLMSVTSSNESL